MSNFKKLIGHNYIFNNLVNLYNNNNLPNKLILSGKKGIGKSLFAKHFLNYIFSLNEDYKYDLKNFQINILNKSNILLENNSHPNVYKIYKKKDNKNIEISQIREMNEFQNFSSFNNKLRFVIIDDLENLNLNSANSLLKTIEEPNDNLFFILINNTSSKIPETIKSRCIEFKLFLIQKDIKLIVNNYFNDNIYDEISKDFNNFYISPSFIISLIIFAKNKNIDYKNLSIENFFIMIIKNKYYLKEQFIIDNLNLLIELFFYKNINLSKKLFIIKDYFYFKLSQIKKFNLDLESFFLEFEEMLLSE